MPVIYEVQSIVALILFVKDEIIEIPYKITSKNNPDVVEGVLKVQDSNV